MRVALIGLDYDSSFFKRGKQACFKVMKQCDQFISAFKIFWRLHSQSHWKVLCVIYADTMYRYQQSLTENV